MGVESQRWEGSGPRAHSKEVADAAPNWYLLGLGAHSFLCPDSISYKRERDSLDFLGQDPWPRLQPKPVAPKLLCSKRAP